MNKSIFISDCSNSQMVSNFSMKILIFWFCYKKTFPPTKNFIFFQKKNFSSLLVEYIWSTFIILHVTQLTSKIYFSDFYKQWFQPKIYFLSALLSPMNSGYNYSEFTINWCTLIEIFTVTDIWENSIYHHSWTTIMLNIEILWI